MTCRFKGISLTIYKIAYLLRTLQRRRLIIIRYPIRNLENIRKGNNAVLNYSVRHESNFYSQINVSISN